MPLASPYEYYLGVLSRWPTNIALASQWMVHIYFDNVTQLLTNVQNALANTETAKWTIDGNIVNLLLDSSLQAMPDQMIGCVFARQVSLPSEAIDAGNVGLEYGGYLPPATANTRSKYEPLGITMLETNASFLDFVIRPWTILVGYNGLIARSPNSGKNVKASTIDVVMYAKTGPGMPMGIRKIYRFNNCAPISIQSETYSHTEEGLRYSDVKFVYDSYSILSQDSGTLINLP
jgi:hypothetical protein